MTLEKGYFDLTFAYSFIRHVFSLYHTFSGERTVNFCVVPSRLR